MPKQLDRSRLSLMDPYEEKTVQLGTIPFLEK